jgi:histidinol-phosphatase (PHP family)
MKWTNYHSHTRFSDGKGEPELYVKAAIENKLYAYGFSCHSPVPFQSEWNMKFESLVNYTNEIRRLKEKYINKLKIFLGLEIDYVKSVISIDNYKNFDLDYSIGGIHFLGFLSDGTPWDFDRGKSWFKKGLDELFGGDIKKLVSFYYQQITDMVSHHHTDLLAHFDLIKKYNEGNAFFNEEDKWYTEVVFTALETIARLNIIVEVNTRGVLKKLNTEFYPSNTILKRCLELKIPVCLSADTHDPADIIALLPEARDLLQAIGYKEVFIFDDKGWNPVSIFL